MDGSTPRQRPERIDVEAEVSFHLDEITSALIADGWTEAAARDEALRRFGSQPRYVRSLLHIDRAIHRRQIMRSFLTVDLRAAARALAAAPAVTAVAVLSLALGIGANTALFSVLNGLLLKPLPVPAPERLVLLEGGSWTNPIWEAIRDRQPALFDVAFAWSNETFDLAESGETQPVEGAYASGGIFETLGVNAALGRTFGPADDVPGGGPDGPVAVISHALWQERFGGSDVAIGSRLTVNRLPVRIVGVLPRSFFGPEVGRAAHVYLPLAVEAAVSGDESMLTGRSTWWLEIMARLRPDQSIEAATSAINQARPAIREATVPPQWSGEMRSTYLSTDFQLLSATNGRSSLRSRFAHPLAIILAVVGAVLLIACANLANLLVARATARRREMSLRLALGASRARLVGQLLIEGFLLAAAGAAAGLAIAGWGAALLVRYTSATIDLVHLDLALDWRVAGFTAAVALVTALFFGAAPAVGLKGLAPVSALRELGRGVVGDRRFGLRNTLVVLQIALSLVLVIGGGLFLRTFHAVSTTPLGFRPDQLLIVNVNAQRSSVPAGDRRDLYRRIAEAVTAVPGVRQAHASFTTPLSGRSWNNLVLEPGRPDLPPREQMTFQNSVDPGWFEMYGMRLIDGRTLQSTDTAGSETVAVVNEAFVRRFMKGAPAVGRFITLAPPSDIRTIRIVGVVADAVYRSVRAGMQPVLFLPRSQGGLLDSSVPLTIEVSGDRAAAIAGLRAALAGLDPNLSFSFQDYRDRVRTTVAPERLVAALSGFFGVLALLLAALGLYGVTSYAVGSRTPELAVRMALGADPRRVVRLVMGRVAALVAAGLAAGLGLSLWAAGFLRALLFDLDPHDAATFAAAVAALAAVGLTAGWLPARRASRLDPAAILRGDSQ
jgi:predicted permease